MALKFGQAIRDGDVAGVKHFVDQKGAAEALKVKFSFEIMVQRLVVYKSEHCLPPAMESVTIQVIVLVISVLLSLLIRLNQMCR